MVKKLRNGEDVVVGVNLLRRFSYLVSLVAVMDADREVLRSETHLFKQLEGPHVT